MPEGKRKCSPPSSDKRLEMEKHQRGHRGGKEGRGLNCRRGEGNKLR